MSKKERKEELMREREELIRANYNSLAENAKKYCENCNVTFKEWLQVYGLYCSGKDVQADVIELGNAILNAKVILTSDLEEELVRQSSEIIKSDLSLEQATKKLK